jgi:8-oxo-dGTP pyrophosphatase MutT (NUDIX family)
MTVPLTFASGGANGVFVDSHGANLVFPCLNISEDGYAPVHWANQRVQQDGREPRPWRVILLNSSWHLELDELEPSTENGNSRSGVRIIEISAGGIVRAKGKILVLQTLTGEWVLPKGKLEAGESPAEAAVREAREEAGVLTTVVRKLESTRYTRQLASHPVEKTVHWFLMEATDTRVQAAEQEFRVAEWVTVDEAASRLRWDEQRTLVRSLEAEAVR